jgi:hypothetical protein
MDGRVVQSLWIGESLSRMEQLAIRSFLDQGHTFHLYTYQDVQNVPKGTILRSGTEILPADEIFLYRRGYGKGSPSGFSNCFRYKLLLEKGGWWADLDAVCLKPLDFEEPHVVGLEREPDGSRHVAVGLIKAPAGSPLLSYCLGYCHAIGKSKVRWGQIGPRLFARAMQAVRLPVRVLPPEAFYPINYWEVERLVRDRAIPHGGLSVHLWNSRWRHRGLDPDAVYDSECVYEQLMKAHGLEGRAAVRRVDANARRRRPHFLARLVRRFQAAASAPRSGQAFAGDD